MTKSEIENIKVPINILQLPPTIKIYLFDKYLNLFTDKDLNCFDICMKSYIILTFIRIYYELDKKKDAYCIKQRATNFLFNQIYSEECKDLYKELSDIFTINIQKDICPFKGKCKLNCKQQFILTNSLESFKSRTKILTIDQLAQGITTCANVYIQLDILDLLKDNKLDNKIDILLYHINQQYIPYIECRTYLKKSINKILNSKPDLF